MRFLATGDWHLIDKCPENRLDDYGETALNKLDFLLGKAEDEYCDYIIQPGDFFDSPSPSYDWFTKVVNCIGNRQVKIITIFGQHDLRYRNQENTALFALEAKNKNINILSSNHSFQIENFSIYGSGFNESIPKPDDDFYNILLTHRMIITKKLWAEQKEYDQAEAFLHNNKFDLIVSGDNHQKFYITEKLKCLINCGSLLRSGIDQVDHIPEAYIIDINPKKKTMKMESLKIPIQKQVFKTELMEKKKVEDEKIASFVKELKTGKDFGLKFEDNLNRILKKNKIDQEICDIIQRSKHEENNRKSV